MLNIRPISSSRWWHKKKIWILLAIFLFLVLARISKGSLYKDFYYFISKPFWPGQFQREVIFKSIDQESLIKLNLLKNFPDSEYTSYLTGGSGIAESNDQKTIFKEAESEMLYDKKKGIDILKSIIQIDSKDEYALSAAFTIGYYYDQEALIDSALKYYTWIKDNHPISDQSVHATERLNSISLALNSVESDTVGSISGE